MTLDTNLSVARSVLREIRGMGIRSLNNSSHRTQAMGGMDVAVGSSRQTGERTKDWGPLDDIFTQANRLYWSHTDAPDYTLAILRTNAGITRACGVGNCEALSEVTVRVLHDQFPEARPVDIMVTSNWLGVARARYHHAFVVIGLSDGWDRLGLDPRNPELYAPDLRNWGPDAVWCDPWQNGGVAFAVRDLIQGGVRNLDVRLRLHTREDVEAACPRSVFRLN